jgi:hypothetical protein
MYGIAGAPPAAVKKRNKKLAQLLAEDSADEDSEMASTPSLPVAPDVNTNKPWLREFKQYIDGVDEVPNGMTIIKWWGVSLFVKFQLL